MRVLILSYLFIASLCYSQTPTNEPSKENVLLVVDQTIKQWTPEESNPDPNDRNQLQMAQMQIEAFYSLKRLRAAIAQEKYADAALQLNRLRPATREIEALASWEEQKFKLTESLIQLDQTAQLVWGEEIDDYIDFVQQACEKAKSATDLDPALIRGAGLKLSRHSRDSALTERSKKKLDGGIYTVSSLATYFDFKNAGKTNAANMVINQMLSDQSRFPVLDVETIQSFLIASPADWTEKKLGEIVFRDYNGLEDIDITLAHLAETSPEVNQQQRESIEKLLHQFQSASILIELSQYSEALQSATSRSPSASSGTFIYYQILLDSLIGAIVTDMAERWEVSEAIAKDSPTKKRLQELADALIAESKLTELLELSRLLDSNRTTKTLYPKWTKSPPTVTLYIKATAADKAGQTLIAYQKYREIIDAGNYPSDLMLSQVTERMKAIRAEHPEVESDANNQLQKELQELRLENKSLKRRLENYTRRGGMNMP